MKLFIKNIIFFSIMIFVFIETISAVILFTDLFLYSYPGREVYQVIDKSRKKNKSRTLILGDSLGRQLFNNNQNFDSVNSLACNQAISVAGHYFLLHDYLQAGNNINRLIFIYNPLSFRNNLDQVYTFHYFLKPFYNPHYYSLFSTTVKEQIKKVPYNKYAQLPHIKITSWAPQFYSSDSIDSNLFSPVSIDYLDKIKHLATLYNFEFILLPPPINIIKKSEIEKLNFDLNKTYNLKEELEEYFTKITYLDSTEFIDGLHLMHPEKYANSLFAEIRMQRGKINWPKQAALREH